MCVVSVRHLLFEVLALDWEDRRLGIVCVVSKFRQPHQQGLLQHVFQVLGVVVKHRPFFVELATVPKHFANVSQEQLNAFVLQKKIMR